MEISVEEKILQQMFAEYADKIRWFSDNQRFLKLYMSSAEISVKEKILLQMFAEYADINNLNSIALSDIRQEIKLAFTLFAVA